MRTSYSRGLSSNYAVFDDEIVVFVDFEFVSENSDLQPYFSWVCAEEGREAIYLTVPVKFEGEISDESYQKMTGELPQAIE